MLYSIHTFLTYISVILYFYVQAAIHSYSHATKTQCLRNNNKKIFFQKSWSLLDANHNFNDCFCLIKINKRSNDNNKINYNLSNNFNPNQSDIKTVWPKKPGGRSAPS